MKVTDRRMFTDDGELREEYRFLEQRKGGNAAVQPPAATEPDRPDSAREAPAGGAEPVAASSRTAGPGPADEVMPARSGEPPGFVDLVAVLAEPIAFLLGDAPLPDGRSARDLPRARLHIDLLAVLQEKTRGNVSAQETVLLENLLAQLRMRYVEKSRD